MLLDEVPKGHGRSTREFFYQIVLNFEESLGECFCRLPAVIPEIGGQSDFLSERTGLKLLIWNVLPQCPTQDHGDVLVGKLLRADELVCFSGMRRA